MFALGGFLFLGWILHTGDLKSLVLVTLGSPLLGSLGARLVGYFGIHKACGVSFGSLAVSWMGLFSLMGRVGRKSDIESDFEFRILDSYEYPFLGLGFNLSEVGVVLGLAFVSMCLIALALFAWSNLSTNEQVGPWVPLAAFFVLLLIASDNFVIIGVGYQGLRLALRGLSVALLPAPSRGSPWELFLLLTLVSIAIENQTIEVSSIVMSVLSPAPRVPLFGTWGYYPSDVCFGFLAVSGCETAYALAAASSRFVLALARRDWKTLGIEGASTLEFLLMILAWSLLYSRLEGFFYSSIFLEAIKTLIRYLVV
jgi:hypothetical protein